MPKIIALSQPQAELYKPSSNEVLISIATPDWIDTKYPQPVLSNWSKNFVLSLSFHDSDPKLFDGKKLKHMTWYDGHQIIAFADEHLGKDFVVHCWKGASRSATIATVLQTVFAKQGYTLERPSDCQWKTNNHVRGTLFKAVQERRMEQAIHAGFLAYRKRGDIHEEEKNMSSQMYEAGWRDCLKHLEKK